MMLFAVVCLGILQIMSLKQHNLPEKSHKPMRFQSVATSVSLLLITASLNVACTQQPIAKPTETASPVSKESSSETVSNGKNVRLGIVNWPGYMPWHVVEQAKIFKHDQSKFQSVYYDGNLKGVAAFVSGQLEANAESLLDTMLSVAEGSDQVVVLALDNSNGNDKIIAKSGINSIKDLKGKTVATEKATISHYLLLLALKKDGLTEKDVNINFLEGEKGAEAFAAGKVDAVSVFTPVSDIALKKAGSKEIATSKDFPGAVSDVLSFKRKFVEEHPEIVQATVNSWFDALAYIKANPAKANEMMAKRSSVSVSEYVKFEQGVKIFNIADNLQAFKPGKDRTSLAFSAEELKKAVIDLGMTKKTANVSKLFDDRFIKAYAESHK
jgi:NitT/TauT family transport system substrate-binding protein